MAEWTCPVCGTETRHPDDIDEGYCPNCHAFTRTPALTTWTIFDKPEDEPNYIVVRGFDIFSGKVDPVPRRRGYLFRDIDTARGWLNQEHPGLARVAPDPSRDHSSIVESWI